MDTTVLLIFIFVYTGMILGRIPGLALDRTGVALLGAIALIAFDRVTPEDAIASIDVPTMALLFGLMVVSAQFRLGGAYTKIVRRLTAAKLSPPLLLGGLILVSGVLSAVLAHDIFVLAMTPILIEACARKGLEPLPYLLGLAASANVGSAATLIGNPQLMLIGQTLHLSFSHYLWQAGIPSLIGMAIVWGVISWMYRGRWRAPVHAVLVEPQPYNRWQTSKAVLTTSILMSLFLFTPWPRDILAVTAAGVLLASRKLTSRSMLGQVDWQLLVLFAGLFIVNHALSASGILQTMVTFLQTQGMDLHQPVTLFMTVVVLSNVVSNVPSTMLLLPSATHPLAGPILGMAGTFAGNLFIVGSIANIIVVEQARLLNVRITWRDHARVGIPVTVGCLTVAALWLWMIA
ncbi:MAG: anion transporter [candidate division Zixibacteria bacterium]|nr:anion transporter [candidate division Zixibacteria bacterium]